MKTISKHYIDGAFVESHGREVMDSINPTNGNVLARVTLADEVDIARCDVLSHPADRPEVADQFTANILWMSTEPMLPGRSYLLKIGARTTPAPGTTTPTVRWSPWPACISTTLATSIKLKWTHWCAKRSAGDG